MTPSVTVLGVDGCPGGWLAAAVSDSQVRWLRLPDARAVLAVPVDVIGIDIPIGLPATTWRGCDLAARSLLGAARSSVFLTPVRAVLAAGSYPEANALSRGCTSKGLSKQMWNILDRVRDVDGALGTPPDPRVIEVHPEVSFRHLDPAVVATKRSAAGVGQRLRALRRWLDVDEALAGVPSGPGLDDALDALVVAWSARRWRDGAAVVLPGADTPLDECGRPMQIIA